MSASCPLAIAFRSSILLQEPGVKLLLHYEGNRDHSLLKVVPEYHLRLTELQLFTTVLEDQNLNNQNSTDKQACCGATFLGLRETGAN